MSKKQPKVSVIVVNYNGKKYTKDCLDSVLKSTYPNFETILVENGSTDNSYQYFKKHYQSNKKIKIVKSPKNLYFTGGSNLGAKKAQGEKLIFLNNDTEVKKDWINHLIKLNQGHPNSLIQPKILSYYNKKIIDNVGGNYVFPGFGIGKGRNQKDNGQYNQNYPINYANGTCFLIDKKLFQKLNGFDDTFKLHYEDVDLNLRAQKQGSKSYYCYQSVIYHKKSLTIKKEISNKKLIYHIRKNRLKTVEKNFQKPQKNIRLFLIKLIHLLLYLKQKIKKLKKIYLYLFF